MQRSLKKRKADALDSAGLTWGLPTSGKSGESTLQLQGFACTIFEGGSDPEKLIMPWQGDASILVDRFDGRLLLDSLTALPERADNQQTVDLDSPAENEIDTERYADLDYSREGELSHLAGWFDPHAADLEDLDIDNYDNPPVTQTNNSAHRNAIPFVYGNQHEVAEDDSSQPASNLSREPAFQPPFEIPEGISVPESLKIHKIISQTANFVRAAGKQSIFILRVKQAENANFAFLMPNHRLHAYFQWLIDTDPREVEAAKAGEGDAESASTNGIAMVGTDANDRGTALGLLDAYGGDTPKSKVSDLGEPLAMDPDPEALPDGRPLASKLGTAVEASEAKIGVEPPSEIQAVISKLVAFVKRNGPKFEASIRQREKDNPLFDFLQPETAYHQFYRQQLSKALGQGVAATILPTTAFEEKTEIAKPTMLSFLAKQQPVKAPKLAAFTEEADRPSSQPLSCKASQPVSVKGGTVRANPPLVKIAIQPMTQEKALSLARKADSKRLEAADNDIVDKTLVHRGAGGGAGTHTAADSADHKAVVLPGDRATIAYSRGLEPQPPAATELQKVVEEDPHERSAKRLRETEGDLDELQMLDRGVDSGAKHTDTAAEEKKAQRRRLARELLKSKQLGSAKPLTQPPKLGNLRSVFLTEEDDLMTDDHPPEPGEILAEVSAPIDRAAPLPKLEELLKTSRRQTQPAFSELEVISPERPKSRKRSRHKSSKKRHKGGSRPSKQSRARSQSDTDSSNSSEDDRETRRKHSKRVRMPEGSDSRSDSGSNPSRIVSDGSKGRQRSREKSKKLTKDTGKAQSARSALPQPEELRERVRAMVRDL